MLKEKKHVAQMHTRAFSSHDSTGVSCQAFAFQPAAHGLSVIKGCGVQKKEKGF